MFNRHDGMRSRTAPDAWLGWSSLRSGGAVHLEYHLPRSCNTARRATMSSTPPVAPGHQLPREYLLPSTEASGAPWRPRTRAPGPSRPTPTPSGCWPPTAKPTAIRSSPANFAASTSRSSSPTNSLAGSRRPPTTATGACTPSSSGLWLRVTWRPALWMACDRPSCPSNRSTWFEPSI